MEELCLALQAGIWSKRWNTAYWEGAAEERANHLEVVARDPHLLTGYDTARAQWDDALAATGSG